METSIFNNTNQKCGDDISDLLNQIRALQSGSKPSNDNTGSQNEISNIEQQETSLKNNEDDINPWGDVVDDFFEQSTDANVTPTVEESKIVVPSNNDNLSEETAKATELIGQIPDNPPFVCYLHGLTEDVSIMDIGMAFMELKVKFTEIKMPSGENDVGEIVFKERSGLLIAIERQYIEINDIHVILSLSMDAPKIADPTEIILVDENKKLNNETIIVDENTNEEEPIETIQPIQDYIELSTIPLYPPYSLHLFNLPKDTSKDEITELFKSYNLAEIRLIQNVGSTIDGCIEFKSRSNLISIVMDHCNEDKENNMLKIRDHRVILSFKKDYTLKYEKSDKILNILKPSGTPLESAKLLTAEIPISPAENTADLGINTAPSLAIQPGDTNDTGKNCTDSTTLIIPDENISIKVVDGKAKQTTSIELIQPIQNAINMSKISLYPPYFCYLFNLPKDTSDEEITKLFEKYNLVSIRLPNKTESRIFGYIEFKSRTDLVTIFRDCHTVDKEKMFKIRNHRVIISLSEDDTLIYEKSNKLPTISSSQTSSNLRKSPIPTTTPIPTTATATTTSAVALPINEQQIPFNPPYLLYLFNISPDLLEENAKEMIADIFKIINLDVTNVQKCLTNSYSVEFSKRSDLVVAIRKNNFFLQEKPLTISITPKLILSHPQTMANDNNEKRQLSQNDYNRTQPQMQMQQNHPQHHTHQSVQHQSRQPFNQQPNRQSFQQPDQHQKHQSGNQKHLLPPPRPLMQFPQLNPVYESFKSTILIPNSPSSYNWIKILNFPPIASDKNLIDLLKNYTISLARIILINNGLCFCQFPSENEFMRLFSFMLTTKILLLGVPIIIVPVTVEDLQQIALLLARTPNKHQKPLTGKRLEPVQPKVQDNNQSNIQPTSSTKAVISLADQLAKLSGETIDNKIARGSTEQSKEPQIKIKPFKGSAELTNKQDNVDNIKNTTIKENKINNNNNRSRGRGQNNRNKDCSPLRRDPSQQSCASRVSNTSHHNRRRRYYFQKHNVDNQNPWANKLAPKLQYDCIKCKKISSSTCSNCGMFYCSLECQTKDWPTHKNNCKIPKLISSTEFYEKLQNQTKNDVKPMPISVADLLKVSNTLTNDLVTKNAPLVELNIPCVIEKRKQLSVRNQQELVKSTNEIRNQPQISITEKEKNKDKITLEKEMAVPLKITTVPFKISTVPSKVTDVPLKVTDVPLKVTTVPLKVTDVPIKLTTVPLKETIETPMMRGQINVPYCDIPKPGDSVFISAVLDGVTVFIRSASLEQDTEYTKNLSDIAEYGKSRSKLLVEMPILGQVILAPLNNNLQRALVLKQKENLLAVAFIDFGNIGMVKFDECYDLSGNLQMLKRYVHKCTIDVSPNNRSNEMSKQILDSVKGIKLDLVYKMPFINTTLVDLVNPMNGISVKNVIGNI